MSDKSGDPTDIEALAAAEHVSWSSWLDYMLMKVKEEALAEPLDAELVDGWAEVNRLPCIRRWIRQMNTPYEDLPEKEKESDRIEARKKLKVYRP